MAHFTGTVVNQKSSDQWQELSCPNTWRFTISVAPPAGQGTGGIVYQLGNGFPAAIFDDDNQPLRPATHNRERRCDAIRFKSLIPGKPAVVDIETATKEQIGG